MLTDYHSQYYAYELTRRYPSDRMEKLSQSLFNATVDLNPHQIDAALFAFRSPLSRGAILADEVGLGKTIEAGIIISQLWAERKKHILCIIPAALRKQWNRELVEKFFINSMILESRNFNECVETGVRNPFMQEDRIIICSYQFARNKRAEIMSVPWDLVVIDEAHRLRNVYRSDNKIARAIRDAIGNRPKVLLTATPLQNSLMELFGLVSFIDPHLFGSEESFREMFAGCNSGDKRAYEALRARISPVCQRTLRRQVTEYVKFTNRASLTQDFTPTDEEQQLYDSVSTYLQRPDSQALPSGQRSLMTLVLRKILASSSYAISDTLGAIIERLERKQPTACPPNAESVADALSSDYESLDETRDEWNEDPPTEVRDQTAGAEQDQSQAVLLEAIRRETDELKTYRALAQSITVNAKAKALVIALDAGFRKAAELGAPRRALIFTESCRTQRFLKEWLSANGYAGQIVTFSGTNSDPDSRRIYHEWLKRHAGDDSATGSATADLRSALVEEFETRASIMIATESGAEGINLQFCNLVVNYDLPWNPQRIEQRIGRCHRYGQKHDVVVINFLNRGNAADRRVFELLRDKFRLFDGVFGVSDEVLGTLGSGTDFEKRINGIYQNCRSEHEINHAFDQLQLEFDKNIQVGMDDARTKLMEHFDAEVHTKLRDSKLKTEQQLGRFGQWLWLLSRHELGADAEFSDSDYTFNLTRLPKGISSAGIVPGKYRLVTERNGSDEHHYRVGHPLAAQIIARSRDRSLSPCGIVFRYDEHRKNKPRIMQVEHLIGKSGWLRASLLSINALEAEDHVILSAFDDDEVPVTPETCKRLFSVAEARLERLHPERLLPTAGGAVSEGLGIGSVADRMLRDLRDGYASRMTEDATRRSHTYFDMEILKLEDWAGDLKENLEVELKQLDREIRALKRDAHQAVDLDQKVALHRQAKDMEKKRNDKRKSLFEEQDRVDQRKEELISNVEARLKQQTNIKDLFTVRWRVI
jgi:superfamily II DNA or RNA helicase